MTRATTIAGLATMTCAGMVAAGCGGSGIAKTNPDVLASSIHASSCIDSGYYIESRLDNSKAEVYDCQMNTDAHECVTQEGGLPRNVTEQFKLLMQQTITDESSKPICALG